MISLMPVIELFTTTTVTLACSCIMAGVINKFLPNLVGKK